MGRGGRTKELFAPAVPEEGQVPGGGKLAFDAAPDAFDVPFELDVVLEDQRAFVAVR